MPRRSSCCSLSISGQQWHILYEPAAAPTPQRDFTRSLDVRRVTLSGTVSALTRKVPAEQGRDPRDRRQKTLAPTADGKLLWERLPDPIALILRTAFDGVSDDDLATTARILSAGTARLNDLLSEGAHR